MTTPTNHFSPIVSTGRNMRRTIDTVTYWLAVAIVAVMAAAALALGPQVLAHTTNRELAAADAASAPAADELHPEPAATAEQIRGRAALAQIDYRWDKYLPGWTIVFLPGRDGYYGLTLVEDRRIEIYVRDDQPSDLLIHVIAHEIGHAVDVTLNDGDDRDTWQAARSIDDAPWWPSEAASDFATGAGDFAESFAAWQTGPSNFRSTLGSAPDQAQQDLLAQLSRR